MIARLIAWLIGLSYTCTERSLRRPWTHRELEHVDPDPRRPR